VEYVDHRTLTTPAARRAAVRAATERVLATIAADATAPAAAREHAQNLRARAGVSVYALQQGLAGISRRLVAHPLAMACSHLLVACTSVESARKTAHTECANSLRYAQEFLALATAPCAEVSPC
jgi:hypothetical protein